MYAARRWSVRHARFLESLYDTFEGVLNALHPLWLKIGYDRVEKPVTFVERNVKGFLFDCKMCGKCALSETGMSCPMNCPKQLQNGPCGGVQLNGNCEVIPDMVCVWCEAEKGSRLMRRGNGINNVRLPVDHTRRGTSSWLRVVREKRDQQFFSDE
jgi:hypothetical protein